MILAIDPGSEQSAAVVLNDAGAPIEFWKEPNDEVMRRIGALGRLWSHGGSGPNFGHLAIEMIASYGRLWSHGGSGPNFGHLAIEMIASYGMPVGAEVFMTCVWIGRLIQAWNAPHTLVYRRDVKMFLCGNNTAKDGNIRMALIDRFGGKDAAIGKKKTPGPLYGFHDDLWAALAVAVTWRETYAKRAA